MSAKGWIGRSLQIAFDGEPVAAVRAKRVAYAKDAIDITDGERNGWRRLAERGDVRSIEATVDGVCTILNWSRLLDEFMGESFRRIEIWHPDGTVQVAQSFMANLQQQGESGGAVAFSATWLVTGLPQGLFSTYLTSRPYAIEAVDGTRLDQLRSPAPGWVWNDISPEGTELAVLTPLGGALYGGGVEYTEWPPEATDVAQLEPLGGALYGGGVEYDSWPDEATDVQQLEPLGGALYGGGVEYDAWPEEATDVAQLVPLGGTLT